MLDPRISYQGLIANCSDDPMLKADIDYAKMQLESHYFCAPCPFPTTAPHPSISQQCDLSPQRVNFTSWFKQHISATQNELDEYFKLSQEDFDTCDPLKWWAGHCAQFPNLSHFACDLLGIPGKCLGFSST